MEYCSELLGACSIKWESDFIPFLPAALKKALILSLLASKQFVFSMRGVGTLPETIFILHIRKLLKQAIIQTILSLAIYWLHSERD